MTIRPIFTTFAAGPTNLRTVAEWRRFAGAVLPRSASWERAARYYAAKMGGALVERADDSLVCFTKLSSGKIRRTTYKPRTWGYDPAVTQADLERAA